jgi:hypothetical protein
MQKSVMSSSSSGMKLTGFFAIPLSTRSKDALQRSVSKERVFF